MPSIVLDGTSLAKKREQDLTIRVAKLKQHIANPTLATILVGNNPASKTYVDMKGRACKRVGLESQKISLSKETTTEELLKIIRKLNSAPHILGILLQHPVPSQIDERLCFDSIALEKDVDGVTTAGFGGMSMQSFAYGSATPQGIMHLLAHYSINVSGKNAVVVGRSAILGKPMAMMLLNADATVTICHSKTENLKQYIQGADIVVGAVGKKEFIRSDWIKTGAVVIDAGYHSGGFGDIELSKLEHRAYAYTPVPGGVGPMTINTLITQTVAAGEKLIADAK